MAITLAVISSVVLRDVVKMGAEPSILLLARTGIEQP
jgi:hypothetical protein